MPNPFNLNSLSGLLSLEPNRNRLSGLLNTENTKSDGNFPQYFGNRNDGTPKGMGFFGLLNRPGGGVSTELSIGTNFGNGETEIPLLVPTLTKDEINHLLIDGKPTDEIIRKAHEHAKIRLTSGRSPFAGFGEQIIGE